MALAKCLVLPTYLTSGDTSLDLGNVPGGPAVNDGMHSKAFLTREDKHFVCALFRGFLHWSGLYCIGRAVFSLVWAERGLPLRVDSRSPWTHCRWSSLCAQCSWAPWSTLLCPLWHPQHRGGQRPFSDVFHCDSSWAWKQLQLSKTVWLKAWVPCNLLWFKRFCTNYSQNYAIKMFHGLSRYAVSNRNCISSKEPSNISLEDYYPKVMTYL